MPGGDWRFSRLAGAALGCLCGDALGMPVEGHGAADIAAAHGVLDQMLSGRLPAGSYTDDSQMTIAILRCLAARGRLDPADLARCFAAAYQPWRGYGGRIAGVMERITGGAHWSQAGTDSFGNGGAMRVGVLGAFYADDQATLARAAEDQCRVTHHHSRAVAGAVAMASAVALACRLGRDGLRPSPRAFVEQVAQAAQRLDAHVAARLRAMPALPPGDFAAARDALVAAYARDVTAAEAVPPAMGAFLWADSAEAAIVLAVNLGNDADTMGAMAGALAGAHWGLAALPRRWLAALENGPGGRDDVLGLCRRVCEQKSVDETSPG